MDPITEPIPNEQNDNNNEQEEQIEQQPQIKKKELSQKQIDHLNNPNFWKDNLPAKGFIIHKMKRTHM